MALLVKQGTFETPRTNYAYTQVVTDVGFRPKALIFSTVSMDATQEIQRGDQTINVRSFGFATSSTDQFSVRNYNDRRSGGRTSRTNANEGTVVHMRSDGSFNYAIVTSMDDDGFTLNWPRMGFHPPAIVSWIALGGDDLVNAKALNTGFVPAGLNQVTVGFRPNTILFADAWDGLSSSRIGFAVATPTEQWVLTTTSGESGTNPARSTTVSGYIQNIINPSTGSRIRAQTLESFDTDGFTTRALVGTNGVDQYALALELKEPAVVGTFNQPATPSQTSHTITENISKSMIVFSHVEPSGTRIGSNFAWGSTDGDQEYSYGYHRGSPLNAEAYQSLDSTILARAPNADNETYGKANVALTETGFNTNWTISDGTPREFIYIAFVQGLPIVEASGSMQGSSNVNVLTHGTYAASVPTAAQTELSSKFTALRLDKTNLISTSHVEALAFATYNTKTSAVFSVDMTLAVHRTASDKITTQSLSELELALTRVQQEEVRLAESFELKALTNRVQVEAVDLDSKSVLESIMNITGDTGTSLVAGADLYIAGNKTGSAESSFEALSVLDMSSLRVQNGVVPLLSKLDAVSNLYRVRPNQSSLISESDMSLVTNKVASGLVDLQSITELEALFNVTGVANVELDSQSLIFVRLSPRSLKTYEKVFAQPQIRIAIAKQIGLPHGEFQ